MNSDVNEIYKAPEADLILGNKGGTEFFPVSLKKLCVMYVATMGGYLLVFFYQHWKRQKIKHRLKVNPVMRAVFSIFFTHNLFNRMKTEAERRGIRTNTAFSSMATVYVLCMVGSWISSNMPALGSVFAAGFVTSTVLSMVALYPLYNVQKAANLINDDKDGELNAGFTVYNWIFIVLGIILWITSILGVFMVATFPEMQGVGVS